MCRRFILEVTDGTQRASTEALLKTVIRAAWTAGGKPTILLMGATQKQAFSAFTGIATQYQEPKGKAATVIGAVDRYVSDFGTFNAPWARLNREGCRSSLRVGGVGAALRIPEGADEEVTRLEATVTEREVAVLVGIEPVALGRVRAAVGHR